MYASPAKGKRQYPAPDRRESDTESLVERREETGRCCCKKATTTPPHYGTTRKHTAVAIVAQHDIERDKIIGKVKDSNIVRSVCVGVYLWYNTSRHIHVNTDRVAGRTGGHTEQSAVVVGQQDACRLYAHAEGLHSV